MIAKAPHHRLARYVTLILCAVALYLGVIVFSGWTLNLGALKNVWGGPLAMEPESALGLALCSMALGALAWFRFHPTVRTVAILTALLVMAISSVVALAEGLGGWRIGLETWLFAEDVTGASVLPTRVSTLGALSTALMGLALLVAARAPTKPDRLVAMAALAATEVLISGVAILSHFLDLQLGIELNAFLSLPLDAALGLLLMGLALVSCVYAEGGLNWVMDRLTTTGIVAGISSLLLAAGLVSYLTRQLQQSTEVVNQTQAIVKLIGQVKSGAADGSAAVRGYVITGDERLARRREQTFADLFRHLKDLRTQLSVDPASQLLVDELVQMTEERKRGSGMVVETRRREGFEAAQKLVMAASGVAQTDLFNEAINTLGAAQSYRQDQLEQRSNQIARRIYLTLPIGVFMSLTFLFLVIFKLNDGTEARQQSDKRNQRLTNLYAALSQTNQAIVHVTDAASLYQKICSVCVDYGHANVAVITLVKGDFAIPEAFAGPVGAVLEGLAYPLDASQRDLDITAMAIHSGQTQLSKNFVDDPRLQDWRERAGELGVGSVAVLPFRRAGLVAGTLSLQIPELNFFTPELVALLEEMVGDLSFALDNMDNNAARAAAEVAVKASEQRIRTLFERAVDGIFVVSENHRIIEANPAALAMLGYSLDEMLKLSVQDILTEASRQRLAERGGSSLSAVPHVDEVMHQRKDGTVFAADVSTSPLPGQQLLAIVRDVSDRKQAAARIDFLANHDALTGMPNRTLMRDRITQAINHAKRRGGQLALMYLDLDRFKVINDGYGHPFGDKLLKAVGERLVPVVREGDTVARQSGDEFLVLLADLHKFSDAYTVSQKILDAFAPPFQVEGREVYVSLSIGISVYPENGEDADELISHADVAMSRSKDLGRSTYQFFTEEMSSATRQQIDLESCLRTAISLGELHLAYQPKVDLQTGRILGCEALLRWNHPELGAVSPARFIPVAEECGLIVPIGDWVLRTACLQSKAWTQAGLPPIVMSVNVSARQFLQQDVVQWVLNTLRDTQLPPELLELELTESLIAQDTEKVITTVVQLKAAGVKFSIDDFGTGYSSLSYLKRFKVNTLKIDQSFIRDMLNSAEDAAIPLAVISMANRLRLKVIAEGVETPEQCDFLRNHGCDEIQGYFFSKPVAADAFAQMLLDDKRLELG